MSNKTRADELKEIINSAKSELNEIRRQEAAENAKALEGKCFVYTRGEGNTEYIKARLIDGKINCLVFAQASPFYSVSSGQSVEYLGGAIEISPEKYNKAAEEFIQKITAELKR
jgi:hypothetical protein